MKTKAAVVLSLAALILFTASPKPSYAFGFSSFVHFFRSVLAEETSSPSGTNRPAVSFNTEPNDDNGENEGSRSGTGRFGTRSGEIRTDVCQIRKEAAQHRRNLAGDRITRLLAYLNTVLTKIEHYYTTKLVPAGKTISNYDALVADIAVKKTAVQTAVTTAQSDIVNISCTAGEIKTDFQKFQTDAKAVETALKAYRDSIKNLLQAIRSVAGEPDAHSATESGTNR